MTEQYIGLATVHNYSMMPMVMRRIEMEGEDALIRVGSFTTDIIWSNRRFIFLNPLYPNRKKGSGIFKRVVDDVTTYLEEHKVRARKKYPSHYWNPKLKRVSGKITATDIDHAYWRIAFLHEYISFDTYMKGLGLEDKSLRLAALANLSSRKEYNIIKNGEITNRMVVLKFDEKLHKVYENIRHICFEHMMNCANLLGSDFICYKTDCLYYKDTPANREKVQFYMDDHALAWKQLSEQEVQKPTKKQIYDNTEHSN